MRSKKTNNVSESVKSEEASASRRKVLQAAIIGGTGAAAFAPTKWTKPVVDSVLIPAHAVTSEAAEEVDTDDDMMPVMRTFFGGAQVIVMNQQEYRGNDVQIAGLSEEQGLLDTLKSGVSQMLIPEAQAQGVGDGFSLCVDDNDGSLSVTLEQQVGRPNGVIHYTGSGSFDSSIALTTTCELPFEGDEFSVTLTDTNNDMVSYVISPGSSSGMIPLASCGLAGQVCPVFGQEKDVNPV